MKTFQNLLTRSAFPGLLILLAIALGSGALQAQTIATAQMADGVVLLDENAPLTFQYQLDMQDMTFENEQEALDFFTQYNTQRASFLVYFEEKRVEIHIELRMEPTWTISDWNAYLLEIMKTEISE